jgi:LuxR family transcriptional regulator, maltose regulon positive regulatory protein
VPRRARLAVPVETKLHAPPVREEWVARGELVDYLAGVQARLVLVEAPAGSGKTTLVAQWSSSPAESRPFAWITLDRGDNDPARLWWHVGCVLQRACPKLDLDAILGGLAAQAPDIAGRLLPLLLNALASLPDPVVLVLDDYHVIKAASCQDHVAFLVRHLPPAVQLVLVTRAAPALPLARLRAAGELTEIRARELRFSPSQVAQLVAAVAGLELSEPDLADLGRRTEGWPAGVYLVALALRRQPSPSAFIRQLSGDSRFVVDFLGEEVLSHQSAEVRQFLARTSVLSRFCAPLCEAVVGSANAAEIIDLLERENLFVVPLDDTRQWFRYHHLFAQMLRTELAKTEPEIVPALHQRASDWLRRSGRPDEAISHARAAGDTAAAIDLITRNWYAYVGSGRVETVLGWLGSLGNAVIAAHPVAAHCAAWTAAMAGDRESVQRWLPAIEAGGNDGPLPDGVRSLLSSAALLKGSFGFEGVGPMRAAAAQAVTLEPDPTSPWHALAGAAYASALYWSGDLDAAAVHAQAALVAPGSVGVVRAMASATLSLVVLDQAELEAELSQAELDRAELDRAELDRAEQLARSARDIVTDPESGIASAPQSSLAYAAVGAVLARRGLLTEARHELEQALQVRHSQSGVSPWPTVEILIRLAHVLSGTGDLAGAIALAEEARQLLATAPAGTGALLARLERLERPLATNPPRAAPAGPLTDREVAVLRMLSGTLSLREIGEELYLSQNTIKTHTRAIYRKLEVSSRPDALVRARKLGVL